jgi:DinB family protein
MDMDWAAELAEQLDWHWKFQLRPRLDGLTDREYFWEPVADCWNIRREHEVRTSQSSGSGDYRLEFEWPEPDRVPVTTIAWRLGHIISGCLLQRSADHFGGEPYDRDSHPFAGTAAEALAQVDAAYQRWNDGVRAMDHEALISPCGPAEGPFHASPMSSLVLHINRELIHHGAELALLRDLYLREGGS